ncbi:MAG: thymidine phosphorylase [Planctomycetota bacterium]
MNPVWIIAKKRDGGELADGEIADFVAGFADGSVPDYQMSALAMAIFLQGMTVAETASLTRHMLDSGVRLEWPGGSPCVDKHSTGGVGDKVSLPLAAMLAECGVRVPMISGRGLGSTGGTLDKLESIPGFRTDLSLPEIHAVVDRVGCVITGASAELAPADKKLYALRDVTATVPSIPLITASIMSKKLAEGLDALVLDVKCGSGAFMKTVDQARELARSLVRTGREMGVATTAVLTDMNQPLGRMVGNAVEVDESVDCLRGEGPDDLLEVTLALGGELLVSAGKAPTVHEARRLLEQTVTSGAALSRFDQMVSAQGGNPTAERPVAPEAVVESPATGFVTSINAELIGEAVIAMRGGRKLVTDRLDHSTGLEMLVRLGDRVDNGQPLARIFAKADTRDEASQKLLTAIRIGETAMQQTRLVLETISH